MKTKSDLLIQAVDTLNQAYLQIEYLHRKFSETGSGNGVLAQIQQTIAALTSPEPAQQDELPDLPPMEQRITTVLVYDEFMRKVPMNTVGSFFTADQMRAYALQARASVQQETASKRYRFLLKQIQYTSDANGGFYWFNKNGAGFNWQGSRPSFESMLDKAIAEEAK